MPDDKLSGVRRLSKSSVAIVVLIALAGVFVLLALGRIDGTTAVQAALVLVGILAGKTAIEDGAQKVGENIMVVRSNAEAAKNAAIEDSVRQGIDMGMKAIPEFIGMIKAIESDARDKKLAQMRELVDLREKIERPPGDEPKSN